MKKIRLPISVRLTFWYGLTLLILLSVFVVFLYASIHVSLHRDLSEEMANAQRVLLAAIKVESGPPRFEPTGDIQSVGYQTDGPEGTYFRLLSASGRDLYRSPNFASHKPFAPVLPVTATENTNNHVWEGAPARSDYTPVRSGTGQITGWLEVTRLESTIHRELHRLEWLLAIGIVVGALSSIGIGYWLARRALRPMSELNDAAKELSVTDLGRRLPAEFGVHDELTDLAGTFNGMLDRLQDSFDRERRFRADAAHEMFTPLSATLSEIDVALHRPRDSSYYEQAFRTVRSNIMRMSQTLDGLLELSRAESAEQPVLRSIDVQAFASLRLTAFKSKALSRGVLLESDLEAGLFFLVDPRHAEAIFDNIVGNAIKYTPNGGTVRVVSRRDKDEVVLSVTDEGIGIDEAERPQLFDRFFRSSETEVQKTTGSGLGLSIAKVLVELNSGRIEVFSEGHGRGSTFEIRLPESRPGVG